MPQERERPWDGFDSSDVLEGFQSNSNFVWGVLVSLILGLLTFLAYSNSLYVPFILDDIPNIKESELITRFDELSFWNIKRFWISRFERGRPLARFTLALNYCFGRFSPVGYHVVNILIHILSGIGVFFFTRLLLRESPVLQSKLGKEETGSNNVIQMTAGFTALIWTLHPVQTQAVTYIVQRMTALAGMFYFWGLYFYLRRMTARTPSGRWGFFFLTVLFFFLGLGSKEIVATLPVAIWLIHWLLFSENSLFQGRQWMHMMGAVLFVGVVGIYLLTGGDQIIETLSKKYRSGGPAPRDWSTGERLMTQTRIVMRYLMIALVPLPHLLNLDRHPTVSTGLFSPPTTFVCAVVLLAVFVIALKYQKKYPVPSFCICWFGLHLAMTSFAPGLELMFDHRLYLSLFGPVFLLVYLFITTIEKPSVYSLGIGCLVPVLLGMSTFARNMDWSSELSIYQDIVQKTPRNPRGQSNLGFAHYEKAEMLIKKRGLDRAYEHLQEAKKRFVKAIDLTENQLDRKRSTSVLKLRATKVLLAYIELERGNVTKAFGYLNSIDKSGSMRDVMIPIIRARIEKKNFVSAVRRTLQILSRVSDNNALYYLLTQAYVEKGHPHTAMKILNRAPEPEGVEERVRATYLRGRIFLQKNQPEKALAALQTALDEGANAQDVKQKLIAEIHAFLARYHHDVTGNRDKRGEHARKALQMHEGKSSDQALKNWANQAGNNGE